MRRRRYLQTPHPLQRPEFRGGRRPAVPADKTDAVRTAYVEGRSTAALVRHCGAIRTAVAGLVPDHTAVEQEEAMAPESPVTFHMPG